MLLRVSTPYFVAGAVWEPQPGGWRCVRAAPILRWMVGLPPAAALDGLKRRGATWEWLKDK